MSNIGISLASAPDIVKKLIDLGVMYEATLGNVSGGFTRNMVIDMAKCNPTKWADYCDKAEKLALEHGRRAIEKSSIYPVVLRGNDKIMWKQCYAPFTTLAGYISDALGDTRLEYHDCAECDDIEADMVFVNGKEIVSYLTIENLKKSLIPVSEKLLFDADASDDYKKILDECFGGISLQACYPDKKELKPENWSKYSLQVTVMDEEEEMHDIELLLYREPLTKDGKSCKNEEVGLLDGNYGRFTMEAFYVNEDPFVLNIDCGLPSNA